MNLNSINAITKHDRELSPTDVLAFYNDEYDSSDGQMYESPLNSTEATNAVADITIPNIIGYEDLQKQKCKPGHFVPATLNDNLYKYNQGIAMPLPHTDFPVISTEAAIEALHAYVESSCLYRKSILKNLCITKNQMHYCYVIYLDTLVENRFIGWTASRMTSDSMLINYKRPEGPWSIPFNSPDSFDDYQEHYTLSKFAENGICPKCGHIVNSGEELYSDSNISSSHFCDVCGGKGYVKRTIHVQCTHSIKTTSNLLNHTPIDSNLLKNVGCHLVYTVQGEKIKPEPVFLDKSLNTLIATMCKESEVNAKATNSKICQQQLFISVIPVRYMECKNGSNTFNFAVYDHDHKVVCDNYPMWFGCLFKTKKQLNADIN